MCATCRRQPGVAAHVAGAAGLRDRRDRRQAGLRGLSALPRRQHGQLLGRDGHPGRRAAGRAQPGRAAGRPGEGGARLRRAVRLGAADEQRRGGQGVCDDGELGRRDELEDAAGAARPARV